jgi:hypothetical protein
MRENCLGDEGESKRLTKTDGGTARGGRERGDVRRIVRRARERENI